MEVELQEEREKKIRLSKRFFLKSSNISYLAFKVNSEFYVGLKKLFYIKNI